MAPPPERLKLPRILGTFEAFSLVVSSVLGASIFIVPSTVAAEIPFVAGIAAVWIAGGLFSLAGSLTYAELGAMLPQAGGGYVYLEQAFGPLTSFLFVWADFLLVRAGAAAAISVGFAAYASGVLPPPRGWSSGVWQACIAICVILVLGLLNVAGTKLSGLVQVLGTILKSGAIVLMILLPWIFVSHVHFDYLRPALPSRWSWPVWRGMMAAMVPVLWSYGGWDQLSHMAEEIRNPDRNLPRAFGFGLVFIAVLYAGAAVAIQLVFPIPEIAKSQTIGSDFFRALLSSPGVALITVVVMFSAVTSAHMALMSGSRSCFAIARGKLFPPSLARLHRRFDTPANAITAITVWSCLLVAGNAVFRMGSRPLYVVLISYVMFAMLLFSGLIFFAAIRLRVRHPEWKRPYRVWGYPVTPLASILVTVFLLITMLTTSPWESCSALAVILLGWPVYLGARKKL